MNINNFFSYYYSLLSGKTFSNNINRQIRLWLRTQKVFLASKGGVTKKKLKTENHSLRPMLKHSERERESKAFHLKLRWRRQRFSWLIRALSPFAWEALWYMSWLIPLAAMSSSSHPDALLLTFDSSQLPVWRRQNFIGLPSSPAYIQRRLFPFPKPCVL